MDGFPSGRLGQKPDHARQRTEAGVEAFLTIHIPFRQSLSLSLEASGTQNTPFHDDHHLHPAPDRGCFSRGSVCFRPLCPAPSARRAWRGGAWSARLYPAFFVAQRFFRRASGTGCQSAASLYIDCPWVAWFPFGRRHPVWPVRASYQPWLTIPIHALVPIDLQENKTVRRNGPDTFRSRELVKPVVENTHALLS